MSTRGRLTTFGIGVTAGAAAYAVIGAGLLTGTTHSLVGTVGDLFRVPSAAAEGLPAFDDCTQLRRWYVDQALPHVGPWGLTGPPIMYAGGMRTVDGVVPQAAGSASASGDAATGPAVGSSVTGTNVQEAGVDESDIAKTDGRLVVQVLGRNLVVTDVSGPRPRLLSRTAIPGRDLAQPELLLGDDRVLVIGSEATSYGGGPVPLAGDLAGRPGIVAGGAPTLATRTRLLDFDLGDPRHPVVTHQESVDGAVVSSREYAGGTVRVVLTDGYPPFDFVSPNRDRSAREATAENKAILRRAPISAWLPQVRSGSRTTPLLACSDVRHPRTASGPGTISVLTFPLGDPGDRHATAVTASGDLVYSSADRLYVATTREAVGRPVAGPGPIHSPVPEQRSASTEIHAFALDGDRTTYVASGTVRGRVADRWSFDEHEGHLRVATGVGGASLDGENARDNAVTVLHEVGGRLVVTGRVSGLGRGQDIESVRWFGDLAVVVTFRRMDPLYTLDLSDPARPEVVGRLDVPGYSAYLHPTGGGQLVGVGHDATTSGQDLGAQAATFDLSDPQHVRRTGTLSFGPDTDVTAGFDPRAFSYLPEQRALVTTVADWSRGTTDFVALHVGTDGTLSQVGTWTTRRYDGDGVRTLPLGGGRIALVGDVVRLVDVP